MYVAPNGQEFPLDANGQPTMPDIWLPRAEARTEYGLVGGGTWQPLALMRGMLPSSNYPGGGSTYKGYGGGGGGGGYDALKRYLDELALAMWNIE